MASVTLNIDASQAIEELKIVNGLLDEIIPKLKNLNTIMQGADIVALRELGHVKSVHDYASMYPTITIQTELPNMATNEIVERIRKTLESELGTRA